MRKLHLAVAGAALLTSLILWLVNKERFTRAWGAVFGDFGGPVQLFAVIFAAASPIILVAIRQGRTGVKEVIARDVLTEVLAGWMVFWFLVFLVRYTWPPPQKFVVADVAAYSQGIVVSICSKDEKHTPIGSGFWADKRHMFTWLEERPADGLLNVGIIVPPIIPGEKMSVMSGGVYGAALIEHHETGVCIAYVPHNPFQRKLHAVAVLENTKTKKVVDKTTEKYWVPKLSKGIAHEGDRLVLCAAESDEDSPALVVHEGHVTRLGMKGDVHPVRIHTTLPFKTTYVGAPALDFTKLVVGIVVEQSDGHCVLMPARYLAESLEAGKESR